MKKALLFLSIGLAFLTFVTTAQAQRTPTERPILIEQTLEDTEATAAASPSATATVSAAIEPSPAPKNDITETVSKQKDALTAYLEANPPSNLTWHNFLQHGIRRSINNGLPANIIVLLILFPIITSIIAASRHVIGLQGFGVYTPAVLSVAFVSTGIVTGIVMFAAVMSISLVSKNVFKRLKLQYLPRTAFLLWGVSLAILTLLMSTAIFGLSSFLTLNIFPLLIIMLLIENFMETQLNSSRGQTLQLTLETLFIAVVCSLLIGNETVQKAVILRPELTFALVAAFNLLIGKYSGLRLLEYVRFRSIMEG